MNLKIWGLMFDGVWLLLIFFWEFEFGVYLCEFVCGNYYMFVV